MDNIENILDSLNDVANKASLSATNAQLQLDTMSEMYKEKEIRLYEIFTKEKETIIKHYTRIILGLVLALVVLLGSIVGAVVYVLSNYEFEFGSYQIADVGGDGTANIYDGIHFNDTSNAE